MENEVSSKTIRNLSVDVLRVLNRGESNAKKLRQIRQEIGYGNERTIRLAIQDLRLSKYLILSSNNGYWLAATEEEVNRWANYMTSYIADLSHVTRVMCEGSIEQFKKTLQYPMFF